jgi:signal recognition particle receptor subunit beta
MVLFNYSTKELTAKVVYYGPGLCGKTTNLHYIHQALPENVKGKMLSLATKTDRTLFFDFLPIDLGEIRGMQTRVQLYTVPGQVFYNETRKLVLKGADGIVFVADSQQQMLKANVESFKNLEENLKGHGLILSEMPHVIQFNKRDLPKLSGIEEMNSAINKYNAPFYESVATTGIGIQDTLKAITKLVLLHLTKKYDPKATAGAKAAPARKPAKAPRAAAIPAAPPTSQTIPVSAMADEMQGQAEGMRASAPVAVAPVTPGSGEPYFGQDDIESLVAEVAETEPPIAEPSVAVESMAAQTSGLARPAESVVEEPLEAPELSLSEPEIDLPSEPQPTRKMEAPEVEIAIEEPAKAEPLSAKPPMANRTFEIDCDAGTDLPKDLAAVSAPPAADDETTITLTDVVNDEELFEDPNLDVARMASGEEREIVIPVELGDGPGKPRRYTLSIRLHLTPID